MCFTKYHSVCPNILLNLPLHKKYRYMQGIIKNALEALPEKAEVEWMMSSYVYSHLSTSCTFPLFALNWFIFT